MIEELRVSSAPLRISFCPLSPFLLSLDIPFCIPEYFDLEGNFHYLFLFYFHVVTWRSDDFHFTVHYPL